VLIGREIEAVSERLILFHFIYDMAWNRTRVTAVGSRQFIALSNRVVCAIDKEDDGLETFRLASLDMLTASDTPLSSTSECFRMLSISGPELL
jgi:hypothetical protein